jgi:Endosomal/lysosomal potassium channel TMEM175
MDRKRAEAFRDGVFAVAITLLALELRVPGGDGSLAHRLVEIWPAYLAYIVSFLTIGIMWLNHHTIFKHIVRAVRRSVPRFGAGFIGYIVATALGFVSPLAALVLFGVLAVYYAFEQLPTPGHLDPYDGAGAG